MYFSGAFTLNFKQPFQLTAGTISPIYIDNRVIQSDQNHWRIAISLMVATIYSEIERTEYDAISGGSDADFAFSYPVAWEMNVPHIAIRKEEKEHGRGARLMGRVRSGWRTVHVADLITDGGSALMWLNALRSEKVTMTHYVSLFDRMQGGKANLEQEGVVLHSLSSMNDEFFQIGIRGGFLTKEDYEGSLKPYLLEPRAWACDFLRRNPEFIRDRITVRDGQLVSRILDLFMNERAYPELKSEFGERIRSWLQKKEVKQSVPEFAYEP